MTSKEALGLLVSRVQVGAYKEEMQKCFDIVNKALKQAQKQEKLLELYNELITVKDDLFYCCEIVDNEFYDIRKIETYLEKQIKELENEKND